MTRYSWSNQAYLAGEGVNFYSQEKIINSEIIENRFLMNLEMDYSNSDSKLEDRKGFDRELEVLI